MGSRPRRTCYRASLLGLGVATTRPAPDLPDDFAATALDWLVVRTRGAGRAGDR
jgi:hypothetical protein